jgi:hypothetical protein
MTHFINYKELKECLSALEVAAAFGLKLRAEKGQLRGQCPACGGKDGREISINTKLKSFYCHSAKRGGSLIDLAAHIMGCDFRDAAEHLQKMFGQRPTRHEPRQPTTTTLSVGATAAVPERGGLEAVRNNLAWQHPDVQRLGLSPQSAEALGIGFQSKGWQKGSVLVPVRTETGQLMGYWAIPAGITTVMFHKSIETNVAKVLNFERKVS